MRNYVGTISSRLSLNSGCILGGGPVGVLRMYEAAPPTAAHVSDVCVTGTSWNKEVAIVVAKVQLYTEGTNAPTRMDRDEALRQR
jgi:hypothetical protein